MLDPSSHSINWNSKYATRVSGMGASEIRELLKILDRPDMISFAGGIPDPALFPLQNIKEAFADTLSDVTLGPKSLQYSVSEGYQPLREWIVGYMKCIGISAGPNNIVITNGSQQALDLIGKLLISPNDTVFVTEPTYLGALQAFNPYQPTYVSLLQHNRNGINQFDRSMIADSGQTSKFAYVVTDFANPTGECLSLTSRYGILDFAEETDIAIVEDGAYSSLRFDGNALPSLLSIDIQRKGSIDKSRVLYCGTFSKILAPGLRVGWLCASERIVEKVVLAKQATDLHSSTMNQIVTHKIARDLYDDQVRILCKVYRSRRDLMLHVLTEEMPDAVTWTIPEGGMFIWLTLPKTLDAAVLLKKAVEHHNIAFVPGIAFYYDSNHSNNLRLSYSLSSESQIFEGIRRLAYLIKSCS